MKHVIPRFLILLCLLRAVAEPCRADGVPPLPFTLQNGLRVVMRPRPGSPLVAVEIWIRGGSRAELPGEQGAAHLLEHLLFRGTTGHPDNGIDRAVESLGGILNAVTGPDYIRLSVTLPKAQMEPALALLSEMLQHPALAAAPCEQERRAILDEFALRSGNAADELTARLYAAALPDSPYRNVPGGTPDTLQRIRCETAAAYYRRVVTPNAVTLALVGSLTADEARVAALHAFADWQRSRLKPGSQSTIPEIPVTHNLPSTTRSPQFAALGIAYPAPPARDTADAAAAQVVCALLGDSENGGRLAVDTLRGTTATARYTPRCDTSLLMLTATLPDGGANAPGVEFALLGAAARLRDAPPAPAELNEAKQIMLAAAAHDEETCAGLAHALGYADIVNGDPPEAFRARVAAIVPADIVRFARHYLTVAHQTTVRLLPPAATAAKEHNGS